MILNDVLVCSNFKLVKTFKTSLYIMFIIEFIPAFLLRRDSLVISE